MDVVALVLLEQTASSHSTGVAPWTVGDAGVFHRRSSTNYLNSVDHCHGRMADTYKTQPNFATTALRGGALTDQTSYRPTCSAPYSSVALTNKTQCFQGT